jgi:hypothetical protein
MTDLPSWIPYLFPLFFAAMWLAVTSLLALMSGWFELQSRFPDRTEAPIRRWSMASGSLGGLASYRSCLVLDVCPSGLRVGVWRLFGPFCRAFFVPWSDLKVERGALSTRLVIGSGALGDRPAGVLRVSDVLASELAAAAGGSWPQGYGAVAELSPWDVAGKLALQWVLISAAAALFFTFAPRLFGSNAQGPPTAVAILFPTLFFGAVALFRFLAYLAGRRPSGAK